MNMPPQKKVLSENYLIKDHFSSCMFFLSCLLQSNWVFKLNSAVICALLIRKLVNEWSWKSLRSCALCSCKIWQLWKVICWEDINGHLIFKLYKQLHQIDFPLYTWLPLLCDIFIEINIIYLFVYFCAY
jgi:hypothetical protein